MGQTCRQSVFPVLLLSSFSSSLFPSTDSSPHPTSFFSSSLFYSGSLFLFPSSFVILLFLLSTCPWTHTSLQLTCCSFTFFMGINPSPPPLYSPVTPQLHVFIMTFQTQVYIIMTVLSTNRRSTSDEKVLSISAPTGCHLLQLKLSEPEIVWNDKKHTETWVSVKSLNGNGRPG